MWKVTDFSFKEWINIFRFRTAGYIDELFLDEELSSTSEFRKP